MEQTKDRVLDKNALAVKHAKAIGGKRTTYRIGQRQKDGTVAIERGLELCVHPSGAATWYFTFAKGPRDARKVKRIVLGHRDSIDVSEACEKAAKLRAAILDSDPAEERKARKAQKLAKVFTFAELARDWTNLHDRPNNSERTVYGNQLMLRNDILPAIGHMDIDKISKRDIIQLADAVVARGIERAKSRGTSKGFRARPNHVLTLVRTIFRWGVAEDLAKTDPCLGVKPRVKQKSRDRVLTADEIRTVWAKLDGTPMSRAVVTAIRLALVTGQRIGECSGIAKSELDLTPGEAVWTIPAKRKMGTGTKNEERHRVPLSPMAVTLIQEAMHASGPSPFLFPDASGQRPIAESAASKALYWVRPYIGIEGWTIHDLRRTVATNMAQLRVDKHVVSLILNHVSATGGKGNKRDITSDAYIKYSYDREKRHALELWGARLEATLKGEENSAGAKVLPMVRA